MKTILRTAAALLLSMYLGLSGGKLAVYHSGSTIPVEVLPYDCAVFTDDDRQALAKGIPFTTRAELSKLLEDFTS